MFSQEAISDAEDLLEGEPFAAALVELVNSKGGEWYVTPTDALTVLSDHQPLGAATRWPRTGRALKNLLKELAPDLRLLGFEYSQEKSGKRRYLFQFTDKAPKAP